MNKTKMVFLIMAIYLFVNIENSYANDDVINNEKVYYYNIEQLLDETGDNVVVDNTAVVKIRSVKRKYASVINIKWTKIKNATGYCVYRSTERNGRYKKVADTTYNNYTDRVKPKQRYYYKVRAYWIDEDEKRVIGNYSESAKAVYTVKRKVNRLTVVDINEKLYTYLEMKDDLRILKKKYPDYFTYKIAGKSYDDRNIYIICLGNKNANKKILVQSTIHGREYMNSAISMAQLEYYLNNWNAMYDDKYTYGDLFNNTCIYIMPMLNPDGVTISQFGYRRINNVKLRNALKSMSGIDNYERWKANARGVDVNRNFDSFWRSSGTPGSSFYSGKKPNSERETRIIKRIINKYKFDFVISYHSMGNVVYWNIGQKGKIYNKTYKLAKEISNIMGYPLGEESVPEGLSYNWTIYEKNIPEIIIENGNGICPLPVSEYKKTWKNIKDLIPEIIR